MPKETKINCPSLRASLDALYTKNTKINHFIKFVENVGLKDVLEMEEGECVN